MLRMAVSGRFAVDAERTIHSDRDVYKSMGNCVKQTTTILTNGHCALEQKLVAQGRKIKRERSDISSVLLTPNYWL
ncbi:MAG: hypothetical protein DRO87_07840 [Candidatus Thorarchaeota archaeon]|nr:MAG: hypothetical protein DRO87_07840 [Candidatus Thorarchaeota archaeon]RLI57757.1 MAG: hypothetical protein DRP09_01585 [Candidatus Thorarchaeota archaeon]